MLEYIQNNQQEVMLQMVLLVAIILPIIIGLILWINRYLYRKHYDFGNKHLELEEFDQSIKEFQIAQKLARRTFLGKKKDLEDASSSLANACIVCSQWEEAVAALIECVEVRPEQPRYHVLLTENYLRIGEHLKARESFDKALSLVSSSAISEVKQENTYAIPRDRKDGEINAELTKLEESVEFSQSERLDKLEILRPEFEDREFILEELAGNESDNLELARLYIRQYILEKNQPEKEVLQEREEREEEELEAEEIEIQEEQEAREDDTQDFYLTKAREALELLDADVHSPEFYDLSAFLFVQKGDSRAAEEHYQKAIKLNPQYAQAYYNLSLLYVDQLDDRERAIENLKNALESNSEFAQAHHNLALLLLGTGEGIWEVKHHFGEAVRINPRFVDVYQNVALLLAKKDFETFILG